MFIYSRTEILVGFFSWDLKPFMVTHENFLLHLKDMQINKILPPKPFIIYKYAGARKHFILAGKSTSLSSYARLGMKSFSKPSLTKSRKISAWPAQEITCMHFKKCTQGLQDHPRALQPLPRSLACSWSRLLSPKLLCLPSSGAVGHQCQLPLASDNAIGSRFSLQFATW